MKWYKTYITVGCYISDCVLFNIFNYLTDSWIVPIMILGDKGAWELLDGYSECIRLQRKTDLLRSLSEYGMKSCLHIKKWIISNNDYIIIVLHIQKKYFRQIHILELDARFNPFSTSNTLKCVWRFTKLEEMFLTWLFILWRYTIFDGNRLNIFRKNWKQIL